MIRVRRNKIKSIILSLYHLITPAYAVLGIHPSLRAKGSIIPNSRFKC